MQAGDEPVRRKHGKYCDARGVGRPAQSLTVIGVGERDDQCDTGSRLPVGDTQGRDVKRGGFQTIR